MEHEQKIQFFHQGLKRPFLDVMRQMLPHVSVKALKRVIDQKGASINGMAVIKASQLLLPNQKVVFDLAKGSSSKKIAIIFEDDAICVIDKPPFMTSSLEEIQKYLKKPYFLCHRLDKETSGLLILAKNKTALEAIEKQFLEKSIKKRYLAIVESKEPLLEQFIVDQPIATLKKSQNQIKMHVHPQGAQAITGFRVVKKKGVNYLLECFPKTGSTHQIRVHLAHKKAPIVGDLVYGHPNLKAPRCLLHAMSVQFIHPISSEILSFSATIPQDFKSMIDSIF